MLTNLQRVSRRSYSAVLYLCGALGLLAQASAVTIYREADDGDLSNNGLAPSGLSVSPGINELYGTTGRPADTAPPDRDYFTFTVPTGYQLVAIVVLPGTAPLGNLSFFGVEEGNQFTVSPTSFSADGLLGYVHYNAANGNIIDDLGVAKSPAPPGTGNSTGFTPPLHAGDYSFWVQETTVGSSPYGFAFQIQAVPEGAPGLFTAAGVVGTLFAIRRRSDQAR
jgi:hypothetical protein